MNYFQGLFSGAEALKVLEFGRGADGGIGPLARECGHDWVGLEWGSDWQPDIASPSEEAVRSVFADGIIRCDTSHRWPFEDDEFDVGVCLNAISKDYSVKGGSRPGHATEVQCIKHRIAEFERVCSGLIHIGPPAHASYARSLTGSNRIVVVPK